MLLLSDIVRWGFGVCLLVFGLAELFSCEHLFCLLAVVLLVVLSVCLVVVVLFVLFVVGLLGY